MVFLEYFMIYNVVFEVWLIIKGSKSGENWIACQFCTWATLNNLCFHRNQP